jgi:chromosomal replication initiation ATPase DnaA
MPRKARIDALGALHHIIIRGIKRNVIFRDEVGNYYKIDVEDLKTRSKLSNIVKAHRSVYCYLVGGVSP